MMRDVIGRVLSILVLGVGVCGCAGHNLLGQVTDDNLYVGTVAQPKGPVAIGRSYSFRFADRWRITHSWIQGTGVRPCRYPGNVFRTVSGFPLLASESEGPLVDHAGSIYYGSTFYSMPADQIRFVELRYQVIGEMPDGFQRTGYAPFCTQAFSTPNGMALWIVKPDSAKNTDDWIAGAAPVQVNKQEWLVKRMPPKDMGATSRLGSTIEYWTLKIPDTPYWLHLRFSGSLRSVTEFKAEHEQLLGLFHQVIDSVKLEPIQPVPPEAMPPFVSYRSALSRKSAQ